MAQFKFGDICEVLNGRAYKQNELLSSGKYPILRVGNFFSSDRWYYSDIELPENKYCDNEDLLFAWSASFGPKIWDGGKVIYHYHIWKLIPDKEIADKFYLYYWLRHSVNRLTAGTHGSVMAHMTKGDMENQQIELPSLQIQKKVSSILRSIDKKIELNNAINNNLEQQAQAIFDNMFPDISNGENTIGDTITPKRGKGLLSKNAVFGNVPVVAGGLEPSTYHNTANTKAPVLAISASGANAGFVSLWNIPIWSSDSSFIDSSMTDDIYFWYVLLKKRQREIYDSQTGSAQPHIYPQHIAAMPISDLNVEDVRNYTSIVTPIFEMIGHNKDENARLATTRDTLLPKLMSGELDVSDIDL